MHLFPYKTCSLKQFIFIQNSMSSNQQINNSYPTMYNYLILKLFAEKKLNKPHLNDYIKIFKIN